MKNSLMVVTLSLLVGSPIPAQELERVLVPIYEPLPVPGAFGSEWVSDFQIHNASDAGVLIENFGTGCHFDPCPPVAISPRTTVPGIFVRNILLDDWNPGAVLKVDKSGVGSLVFQLRIRDLSRSAEGWGTWMPVVRESALSGGPVHLLSVPVEDGYRLMLRVYSLQVPVRVHGRVFGTGDDTVAPQAPDPLLGEFTLDVLPGGPSEPGYAQFSALTDLTKSKGFRLVRVELLPERDVPIWTMVSVTNNATQQVTGVYPNQ